MARDHAAAKKAKPVPLQVESEKAADADNKEAAIELAPTTSETDGIAKV